jgi:hypothetical protein
MTDEVRMKRDMAIAFYGQALARLLAGDLTKEVRDEWLGAWLWLEKLGVREDDADFAAMISGLRP